MMFYSGGGEPFRLPDPLDPGKAINGAGHGPGRHGQPYIPMIVDAHNVQTLLETVERFEEYSREIECVYYWSGGEETVFHKWAQRGALTRVITRQPGRPAQNRIIDGDAVYVWTGEEGETMIYHTVWPGDAGAEALSGIPTWEDVTFLPPEDILFAAYLLIQGERCLLVRTREAVYNGEYIISLETGLLNRAFFTDSEGRLAYEVNAGPAGQGDPGSGYFTLPDGRALY
jgi:hypothetical protein